MYSVMFVEDDAIVRKYLKQLIDWRALDLEIVFEAKNGVEAQDFVRDNPVDIIITDINIPLLNGIELIKYVKTVSPNVKIIALSCHDNYEYIREALKLGAEDYILKQLLNENELVRLLDKLKRTIIAEQAASKGNLVVSASDEEQAVRLAEEGHAKEAVEIMDKHIGRLDGLCQEPSIFWASAASLLNSIVKLASACKINSLELFGTDHVPYDDINEKKDIQELKSWLYTVTAKMTLLCSSSVRLHRAEIRKAIEYIGKNFHLDIDLHDIAKHVGLSPNYFSMLFRKETGKSFVEYLLDLRLEKAAGMLKSTELRIYEVAYHCGFVNHQYFNRVFKDKIGVTPLTFRRNHS